MNYYPEFKNFNYPAMDMYTNMYNKQNTFNNTNYNNQSDSKLYDPYNGLIRGNLFKNLYFSTTNPIPSDTISTNNAFC